MIIVLIAGEISGDLLGADLMKALKNRYPQARFVGVGGEKMQAEGLQVWFPLEALSVMGIVDVLKQLPQLLKMRRQLFQWIKQIKPAVMIGIDAPDFNLGLEKQLKAVGIKTVHYVSPSVWAWRQGRVKSIKKSVDLILTLFPFESNFYHQHKVPVQYVGHPLADHIALKQNNAHLRKAWGYTEEDKIIAVLPGSRRGELAHIAPEIIRAMKKIHEKISGVQFITPLVNAARREQFEVQLQTILGKQLLDFPWLRMDGHSHEVMAVSDCVVLTSGTATLEAMLLKKPMVVVYKWAQLTHRLISPFVKTPFVALPNILANKYLVPELIQHNCTSEKIVDALLTQLNLKSTQALQQEFLTLHQQLRKHASETAASAIVEVFNHA